MGLRAALGNLVGHGRRLLRRPRWPQTFGRQAALLLVLAGMGVAPVGALCLWLAPAPARGAVAATAAAVAAASFALFGTGLGIMVRRRGARLRALTAEFGSLASAAPQDAGYADEIDQVVAAARTSLEKSRAEFRQVAESDKYLAEVGDRLVEVSKEAFSNSNAQVSSAAEMKEALASLNGFFQEAAVQAESVITLSSRSAECSASGTVAVEQSTEQMRKVHAEVGRLGEAIKLLVERSGQLGEILEVLFNVAEQSRLLALNAGIEAARAGQQAVGFAVLAGEVRALAEQSGRETARIRGMIKDIVSSVRLVVEAIGESNRCVEEGLKVSDGAGVAIRQLSQYIQDSSQAATEIASQTKVQSETISAALAAAVKVDEVANLMFNSASMIEQCAMDVRTCVREIDEVVSAG